MTETADSPTSSDPAGPLNLCEPFLAALPISGASVTVVAASGARLTLCSSDDVAARIDELQFELGEGPQVAASKSGEIASITDVASPEHDDWPMLGTALRALPVGAVFCVPIRMGAVTIGVATLYSTSPRSLRRDEQSTALAIASALAGPIAHQALQSAGADASAESTATPALRREVHQATGFILVQLNTTATIAYARLQAYAFANGRTVQDVARDVVTGTLTFTDADQ